MKHVSEEELIAYQLGEDYGNATTVREHLEGCAACAGVAESIAETLRIFSAEPMPQANVEHAWQRLRASLPVLVQAVPERRSAWRWLMVPVLGCLVAGGFVVQQHGRHTGGGIALNKPGPLTEEPQDAAFAGHLENAERLITEVNHSSGGLDEATLGQAHELMLRNAVYIQRARNQGDPAEVSVLEDLGRTLTTLAHEQAPRSEEGWHLSLKLNTDGLLLDLRILEQNDKERTKKRTE